MPLEKTFPVQVLDRLGDISSGIDTLNGGSNAATIIDNSGGIVLGGTAQDCMAENLLRKGFYVQNTSSEYLYLDWNHTADLLSLQLSPGALYEWPFQQVPTGAISIYGATTGQTYFAGDF
jgi:hypothetical protein